MGVHGTWTQPDAEMLMTPSAVTTAHPALDFPLTHISHRGGKEEWIGGAQLVTKREG